MPIWKRGESPVQKMFRMRAAGRYQRFILGTSPSNARYPHFLFGCCGEGNINPRSCAQFGLTFDMGINLGRVCINIHRTTTFGLFAGYELLMRPGKNIKNPFCFHFWSCGEQPEFKHFILKWHKPGVFCCSSCFLSGDGLHDCRHSKGPTLVQSCLWPLLAQPGQWGLYLIRDFCKPAFFPYHN